MNMNPANQHFYSRGLQPFEAEELQETPKAGSHVVLRLFRDELASLNYPVIVENWEKCVGPHASGSKRRKMAELFTAAERRLLGKFNQKFYRWYLITGPPAYYLFNSFKSILLIRRAAAFFASI